MQDFSITRVRNSTAALLQISGYATARHVAEAIAPMREAIEQHKPVVIDLSDARGVDARFFGLLLMLRKQLKSRGCPLAFTGVSLRLHTLFRLNGLGYLLQGGAKHDLSIAV
jgi:N-acetylglucosaminyldiphosphoundecaprenol N-acetyl-beta-D-mannosaminyltransferase